MFLSKVLFRSTRHVALLLILIGLQACAGDKKVVVCPRAGLLTDAQKITHFRPGAGQDLTDIEYEAAIKSVTLSCDVNEKNIDVELNVTMSAYLGAGATASNIRPQYFVTVMTGETIVSKRTNTFNIPFTTAARSVTFSQASEFKIPLSGKSSGNFDVMVGFQLSSEELAYNRNRR